MAESQRRDLLGECNVDGHPIEPFTTECCANCFNTECTRSLSGKLKFDHRTATWFERFFGDKDRMDPTDPRFPKISGQKFLIIDPGLLGRPPEVGSSSAWLDPRDLERPPNPAPPSVQPVPSVPTVAPEPVQAAVRPRQVPRRLLLANAPAQKGQMIPAPPSANTAPIHPKDPWAGPVPDAKDDEAVVSPGARVKMGGGGV
jgi:hypothetical protein